MHGIDIYIYIKKNLQIMSSSIKTNCYVTITLMYAPSAAKMHLQYKMVNKYVDKMIALIIKTLLQICSCIKH